MWNPEEGEIVKGYKNEVSIFGVDVSKRAMSKLAAAKRDYYFVNGFIKGSKGGF